MGHHDPAAYRHALEHGLVDLSPRPLASAIGTSPRVLMFLFENKDELVRALLARVRRDELVGLARLRESPGLTAAVAEVWSWLVSEEHRPLPRLWVEAYARSLVEPDGAWAGFAAATVDDWLTVLRTTYLRDGEKQADPPGDAERTLALAVLRGALLDLLATGDTERVSAAVNLYLTTR